MRTPLLALLLTIFAVVRMSHSAWAEEGGEAIHFEPYKPLYFLMGRPDTKIELSFKGKLVDDVNLYFGYSQLMMWELFKEDPYFRDLNYNPEFFYRYVVAGDPKRWIDFGGFEHESNGKGGAGERSWNRSYVRYHAETNMGWTKIKLFWSVKAWVPYTYNSSNTDIAQFRGVWEVNVTLADIPSLLNDRDDLTFRLYPGGPSCTNPLRGGQELTLRSKIKGYRLLPLLVFQVFHGFGENLLDYRESRWGIRAGVGF